MNRREIDADLPLLEFYFARVVRHMERRRIRTPRKVSRRLVLTTFMQTRSIPATARACGVSPALVNQLIAAAIFRARRLAGLAPVPEVGPDEY